MGVRYFQSERGSVGAVLVRYIAVLSLCVSATVWSGSALWQLVIGTPAYDTTGLSAAAPQTARAVLESGDDWTQNLRNEKFWTSKKVAEPYKTSRSATSVGTGPDFGQRSGLVKTSVPMPASEAKTAPKGPQPKSERTDGANWYSGNGNHRTVCVRLCDGYFWPISFSTDGDNFDRDKRVCEKSCGGSQTRLYVHDNPGQDIEQMVDLKGVAYTKLRTAFLFRTSYDESCKCNAHPWEQASKDRHRIYALEAEKKKGSQQAAVELTRMKSALIDARRSATAVRVATFDSSKIGETARAGSIRSDAITTVFTGHAPLAGRLTGSEMSPPTSVRDLSAAVAATGQGRLQQWAQLLPPGHMSGAPTQQPAVMPLALSSPLQAAAVASSELVTKLPTAPFKLPSGAPAISMPTAGPQTVVLSVPQRQPAPPHGLAVTAPPIIAHANTELGIKAPLAVNTAQLEQVNAARRIGDPVRDVQVAAKPKPTVNVTTDAAPPRSEPKTQREPRVVVRREPERVVPDPRPESRQERRVAAAVVRPTPAPAPRVVERRAPRPAVRIVEAPQARPVQVTAVRSENWRVRVFEQR
jgi:Protein of unknown function (DUF2865)